MRQKHSSLHASQRTLVKRRILIVDSHPLLQRGLASLIETEPDLTVCATAATRGSGLAAFASSRPDLVLTEFSLEQGDGLGLVRDICSHYQGLPVLVHSLHQAPVYAQGDLQAGASGCLSQQELSETLLHAIRRVLEGAQYVSPQMSGGPEAA